MYQIINCRLNVLNLISVIDDFRVIMILEVNGIIFLSFSLRLSCASAGFVMCIYGRKIVVFHTRIIDVLTL